VSDALSELSFSSRGETAAPCLIKTALFGNGPDNKKLAQVFVGFWVVLSVFVYEPDAIEAIRLAVVSNPEYPPDLVT
jgi:hypothetical protein